MKNLLILLTAVCCFSCTAPVKQQSTDDSLAAKKVVAVAKVDNPENALKDKIIGIWTGGESENATFDMRKDSVYYVDQFETYKYILKKDTITMFYTDGPLSFKIHFVKDTLVMESKDFGVSKFWKFKG
jgi:hypothetical protein